MTRSAFRLMCVAGSAFLLGFAFAPPALAGGARVLKGPYLQSLASDSVEVRVELDAPAPVSVAVRVAGDRADSGAPRVVRDAVDSALHAVRVDGLAPATRYQYEVRVGTSVERGELTTAPRPDSTDPFTFLVYGDNRTDDTAHAAVVKAMQRAAGDFLLHTGDFVQDGSDTPEWQTFFDVERPLLRDRCVFSCVGNHELLEGAGANYLRFFGPTSDAHGGGEPPKLFGSFRWGAARFLLLDAMEQFDEGPERAWLDDELARADAEPGLAWRIVLLHQGPWSSGPHGGNARLARAAIPQLLAKHHVDLVFAGHDHIYERGYESPLRYVVSGGGGAPLYPLRGPLPSTRKAESVHHFVEATVRHDAIDLVARRDDGSVIERCGFSHATAGWDCDPAPAAAPASAPRAPLESPPAPRASSCGCATPGASPRGLGSVSLGLAAIGLLLASTRRR